MFEWLETFIKIWSLVKKLMEDNRYYWLLRWETEQVKELQRTFLQLKPVVMTLYRRERDRTTCDAVDMWMELEKSIFAFTNNKKILQQFDDQDGTHTSTFPH